MVWKNKEIIPVPSDVSSSGGKVTTLFEDVNVEGESHAENGFFAFVFNADNRKSGKS